MSLNYEENDEVEENYGNQDENDREFEEDRLEDKNREEERHEEDENREEERREEDERQNEEKREEDEKTGSNIEDTPYESDESDVTDEPENKPEPVELSENPGEDSAENIDVEDWSESKKEGDENENDTTSYPPGTVPEDWESDENNSEIDEAPATSPADWTEDDVSNSETLEEPGTSPADWTEDDVSNSETLEEPGTSPADWAEDDENDIEIHEIPATTPADWAEDDENHENFGVQNEKIEDHIEELTKKNEIQEENNEKTDKSLDKEKSGKNTEKKVNENTENEEENKKIPENEKKRKKPKNGGGWGGNQVFIELPLGKMVNEIIKSIPKIQGAPTRKLVKKLTNEQFKREMAEIRQQYKQLGIDPDGLKQIQGFDMTKENILEDEKKRLEKIRNTIEGKPPETNSIYSYSMENPSKTLKNNRDRIEKENKSILNDIKAKISDEIAPLAFPDISNLSLEEQESVRNYIRFIQETAKNGLIADNIRTYQKKKGVPLVQNFKFTSKFIDFMENKSVQTNLIQENQHPTTNPAPLMRKVNENNEMRKFFEKIVKSNPGKYSAGDIVDMFLIARKTVDKYIKEVLGTQKYEYIADTRTMGTVRHEVAENFLKKICSDNPEIADIHNEVTVPLPNRNYRMDQFITVKKGMAENIRNHIPQMGAPKYLIADLTHSSNTEYIVEKMIKYPPGNKTRLIIANTNPNFTTEDRDILVKEIRNYNEKARKNFDGNLKNKTTDGKNTESKNQINEKFIPQETIERTHILTHTEFAQIFGITPKSKDMKTWSLICSGEKNEISLINDEYIPITEDDNANFVKAFEKMEKNDVFGQWGNKTDEKVAYLNKLEPYYPVIEKFLQFERELGNDAKSFFSLNSFLKNIQLGEEWQIYQTTMIIKGMESKGIIQDHIQSNKNGKSIRQINLITDSEKNQKFEPEKYITDTLTEKIGNIILNNPLEFDEIHKKLVTDKIPAVSKTWSTLDTYTALKTLVHVNDISSTLTLDDKCEKKRLYHPNRQIIPPSKIEEKAISIVEKKGGFVQREEFIRKLLPDVIFGSTDCHNKLNNLIDIVQELNELKTIDVNKKSIIHLKSLKLWENPNDGCIYLNDKDLERPDLYGDPIIYTERKILTNGRISYDRKEVFVNRNFAGRDVFFRDTKDGKHILVYLDKDLNSKPLKCIKERIKDPEVRKVRVKGQFDFEGGCYNLRKVNLSKLDDSREIIVRKTEDGIYLKCYPNKDLTAEPIILPIKKQLIRKIKSNGYFSFKGKVKKARIEDAGKEILLIKTPNKNEFLGYIDKDMNNEPLLINLDEPDKKIDILKRKVASDGRFSYKGERKKLPPEYSDKDIFLQVNHVKNKLIVYADEKFQEKITEFDMSEKLKHANAKTIRDNGMVDYNGHSYQLESKNKDIIVYIVEKIEENKAYFYLNEKLQGKPWRERFIHPIEIPLIRKVSKWLSFSYRNIDYYVPKRFSNMPATIVDDSSFPKEVTVQINGEIIIVKKKRFMEDAP